MKPGAIDRGQQLAAALVGSWRQTPPAADFSARDWDAIAPALLRTGAGALGWWRARVSPAGNRPAFRLLHNAYRRHAIEACVREPLIAEVFERCRLAGVDALLAKGWAISCLYPEPGLRPYGDIDVFVRPDQSAAAQAALADFQSGQLAVDLHTGFPDLDDRPLEDVFKRSREQTCAYARIRVPGPEDQLRHICVHLLRHGAWRPLWLTDLAVAVESVDESFDWDYCLQGSRQRTDGVACAIRLAQQLLGASVERVPPAVAAFRRPSWLAPAVLRQWGQTYKRYTDLPMAALLRQRAGILEALKRRWPNPVESTMSLRAPFNDLPRPPLQLADCLVRLAAFTCQLPRGWRVRGEAFGEKAGID